MKTFLNEFPEFGYFLIAALGGFLRYLANILGRRVIYNAWEGIARVVCAGLLGILAGWLAPFLTDKPAFQQARIYVCGMISIEIIKIIVIRLPAMIDRFIDKNLGEEGKK